MDGVHYDAFRISIIGTVNHNRKLPGVDDQTDPNVNKSENRNNKAKQFASLDTIYK